MGRKTIVYAAGTGDDAALDYWVHPTKGYTFSIPKRHEPNTAAGDKKYNNRRGAKVAYVEKQARKAAWKANAPSDDSDSDDDFHPGAASAPLSPTVAGARRNLRGG